MIRSNKQRVSPHREGGAGNNVWEISGGGFRPELALVGRGHYIIFL